MVSVEHATDDTLERYSMRSLPAPEVESLEEHLLVCAGCRDRLQATKEYVAMKASAARKIRQRKQDLRIGALWALPCSCPSESNPALATDLEPVSVRTQPRLEAIRATGEASIEAERKKAAKR